MATEKPSEVNRWASLCNGIGYLKVGIGQMGGRICGSIMGTLDRYLDPRRTGRAIDRQSGSEQV